MKFSIPGEPTGKGRPRVVRNGAFTRTYTPGKTATYENLVKLEYQRQCGAERFSDDAQLKMTVKAFYGLAVSDSKRKRRAKLNGAIRPTKKPDCDNVGKIIADSCNGLAYRDDCQIVEMIVEKHYAEIPRVEVEIVEAYIDPFEEAQHETLCDRQS